MARLPRAGGLGAWAGKASMTAIQINAPMRAISARQIFRCGLSIGERLFQLPLEQDVEALRDLREAFLPGGAEPVFRPDPGMADVLGEEPLAAGLPTQRLCRPR